MAFVSVCLKSHSDEFVSKTDASKDSFSIFFFFAFFERELF